MKNGVTDTGDHALDSCLVAGHKFYQEGDELIDVAAKGMPQARHVQVRFDSIEYFELLAKYPKTLPAFKGARKVQLAVDDTVYEVHE